MTTKSLALTDALGNLVRVVLLPGQRHDTAGISQRLRRLTPRTIDTEMYKRRHLIGNFFGKLAEFRRSSSASSCAAAKPTRASQP